MTSPATRARSDIWAAALLTIFGITAIISSRSLPFGSVTRPGPGFFPMSLAVALTLVATAVLMQNIRSVPGEAAAPPSRGRTRAAATLVALLIYAMALEHIGFGVATFVLIAFLFRAVEPQRWPIALGGAAVAVIASHVLFRIWLGVRLPIGPWGF